MNDNQRENHTAVFSFSFFSDLNFRIENSFFVLYVVPITLYKSHWVGVVESVSVFKFLFASKWKMQNKFIHFTEHSIRCIDSNWSQTLYIVNGGTDEMHIFFMCSTAGFPMGQYFYLTNRKEKCFFRLSAFRFLGPTITVLLYAAAAAAAAVNVLSSSTHNSVQCANAM